MSGPEIYYSNFIGRYIVVGYFIGARGRIAHILINGDENINEFIDFTQDKTTIIGKLYSQSNNTRILLYDYATDTYITLPTSTPCSPRERLILDNNFISYTCKDLLLIDFVISRNINPDSRFNDQTIYNNFETALQSAKNQGNAIIKSTRGHNYKTRLNEYFDVLPGSINYSPNECFYNYENGRLLLCADGTPYITCVKPNISSNNYCLNANPTKVPITGSLFNDMNDMLVVTTLLQ